VIPQVNLSVLAPVGFVAIGAMAVLLSRAKTFLGLVGLVAGTPEGYSAVLFYLIAYTFMNLGAFGVVVALAHHGHDCERVDSFAGLGKTRPETSGGEVVVLGVCALGVLFLGIFPNEGWLPLVGQLNVVEWPRASVQLLFPSG
jgi:formate hydrogenlyase subunit 3/multisubunit Na+/H+ antiporter MnhD subunit